MEIKKILKKKTAITLFWFLLISSFIFFAFLIHLKARGMQFNFRTWQFVKTGMIILNGKPNQANIWLNGRVQNYNLPARIANLSPASYEIKITASDYQSWQKNIQVIPDKAIIYDNIILFLENPADANVPEDVTAEILKSAYKESDTPEIRGSEIYWQGKMLTRFNNDVKMAIFYPDKNHLVFQLEDELRIADFDGGNSFLIAHLASSEPTMVSFGDEGKTVYFLDNGKIYGKIIR